jgi:hypothetical protein
LSLRDPSRVPEDRPYLESLGPRLFQAGIAAGVLGLGAAVLLGFLAGDGFHRFLFAYLMNYAFFLSLALGALFFVLLQHVTRASWSVVVRRLGESLAAALPVLAILSIPILIGVPRIYEWAGTESGPADALIQHKAGYLNVPFFVARWVLYLAVWIGLSRYFRKSSLAQDESGDVALTLRLEKLSAPGLILYGFTVTFAAFDLLMSLDPHWYSTIYGVYFFSGGVAGFFGLLTLTALGLQRSGRLSRSITIEHYHDLGKMLFTFVFFWAYIAFSQYLLIWYANIPEETEWFAKRQAGAWGWMGIALIAGHFILPFLGLLPRSAKRRKPPLAFWSAWVLVMHWIDVYWLVMPEAGPGGPSFHPVDIACLVGIGGFLSAAVVRAAQGRSLIPLKDPRLGESLTFENA